MSSTTLACPDARSAPPTAGIVRGFQPGWCGTVTV
jgi:hypothetical protein